MSSSAMHCERCRSSASQFVYLDGERVCYNCYNLVDREPTYQIDTAPASDGLRELREWAGVSREMAARRFGVPVGSLERFEQGWATEPEKEQIRKGVARLLLHG